MKRYLFIVLAGCCLAAGCRKIELVNPTEYEVLPFGEDPDADPIGMYLLNEGNMGSNKADLDYLDYRTAVYARGIYAEKNPNVVKELGDVGNDIQIYDGRLFAVINCSHKVEVLLPAINADDDYKSVFAEIRSVFAPAPVQTQDEQLRQYLPAVNMSVWSTPAPEPTPTPTPEPTPEPTPTPTPEPTQSPQLQAALAAREAFLNEQAVYSGYAVLTNVSYAVSELPFAHTSPVAGYTSSGFGYRLHPLENKVKFHYGTDFAANSGTAVCAFADGTVLAAGQDDGYGNYVKVRHADGYTTLYGHCSKLLVRAGETVTAGQEIALVGATGKATGPHLHFELMHDGYYCNPEFYLAAV